MGLVAVALLAAACSGGGTDGSPSATSSSPLAPTSSAASTSSSVPTDGTGVSPSVADVVELRPLWTSEDLRIVDDLDREVLLRGANLNSLGEYWQGDPDHAPTIAIADTDWDEMARRGFSVIRLIVTWSRIEPERGRIDQDYLDQVDAYVTAAAEHGIYTVIDMHQDAYSAFIATEDEAECAEGSRPGKGWDGAPEWATITDGLSTCVTGERNSAPAVVAAWNHFYDDTDGIRGRFAASWAAVAQRFAGRAEVAGYDLLNEPEVSRPAGELAPLYTQLLAESIDAIRAAEESADFDHLIFVEPAIPAADPSLGLVIPDPTTMGVDPAGVVAAPHNYAESINTLDLSIEATTQLYRGVAAGIGVPLWIGEYGFWDTSPETMEKIARYAADEDANVLGGAWWQWRQGCGDPHSIGWGAPADGQVVHLNVLSCPGDVDEGPNEDFLRVLSRGYPRAAPGRIVELDSDAETGHLVVVADRAAVGDEVVVWTPTEAGTHAVEATGLGGLEEHEVDGGRILVATTAAADWALRVSSTAS